MYVCDPLRGVEPVNNNDPTDWRVAPAFQETLETEIQKAIKALETGDESKRRKAAAGLRFVLERMNLDTFIQDNRPDELARRLRKEQEYTGELSQKLTDLQLRTKKLIEELQESGLFLPNLLELQNLLDVEAKAML